VQVLNFEWFTGYILAGREERGLVLISAGTELIFFPVAAVFRI